MVRTYRHLAHETITVRLADRAGKVVEALTATPQHPFFVVGRGAIPLGSLGVGTQIVTRAGPPLVIASLARHQHPHGVLVYIFEVEGDHTYFVGGASGGTWVHNDCSEAFKDEAILRAEQAGYLPGAGQRSVDWDNVRQMTNLAQRDGNWDFLSGDEMIITGQDGANEVVDNGMHRILASGMSGVPLPESMFLRLGYPAPSIPWSGVR